MTIELKLLVWSTALALIQMLIALLAAMAQVGLMPLVGNRENLPAFEGWAGRHRNQRSPTQPGELVCRLNQLLRVVRFA
jgi:hypothetical protein